MRTYQKQYGGRFVHHLVYHWVEESWYRELSQKCHSARTPRSNAGACAMHSYPVAGRENFPRENLIETIAETGVTRKKVERQ